MNGPLFCRHRLTSTSTCPNSAASKRRHIKGSSSRVLQPRALIGWTSLNSSPFCPHQICLFESNDDWWLLSGASREGGEVSKSNVLLVTRQRSCVVAVMLHRLSSPVTLSSRYAKLKVANTVLNLQTVISDPLVCEHQCVLEVVISHVFRSRWVASLHMTTATTTGCFDDD